MSAPSGPGPAYRALRFITAVILALLVIFYGIPFAVHWYDCQQLAPIERAFVRGC